MSSPVPSALPAAQVAPLLDAAIATFRAEVAAMPEPLRRWHPAPGQWCVNEILGHLIEAERRGFSGRIQLILDADEPRFEPWDQDAVARARRDCERDGRALVDELAALRRGGIALVERLRPSDLTRGGQHPKVGHLRVADLLHEWVHHDRNHLAQITAAVQAAVWPHMGNARRFSGGR